MALRREGTVARGFVCDAQGCGMNAIWSPIFCTPYFGEPNRAPILNFTAIQICDHHFRNVGRELSTDHMKDATWAVAEKNGGKPDFDRMFLSRIGVYNPEYHKALETMGLISPGDQVISSDATMPDLPEWPGGH